MALKFTSGLTLNVDAGGAISDISADTQRNSVPTEAGLINVSYVLSSISLPSCHIFLHRDAAKRRLLQQPVFSSDWFSAVGQDSAQHHEQVELWDIKQWDSQRHFILSTLQKTAEVQPEFPSSLKMRCSSSMYCLYAIVWSQVDAADEVHTSLILIHECIVTQVQQEAWKACIFLLAVRQREPKTCQTEPTQMQWDNFKHTSRHSCQHSTFTNTSHIHKHIHAHMSRTGRSSVSAVTQEPEDNMDQQVGSTAKPHPSTPATHWASVSPPLCTLWRCTQRGAGWRRNRPWTPAGRTELLVGCPVETPGKWEHRPGTGGSESWTSRRGRQRKTSP